MGILAIRIPDHLKAMMEKTGINWSEYLRNSIRDALESRRKRKMMQKIHALTEGQGKAKVGTAARIVRSLRNHA